MGGVLRGVLILGTLALLASDVAQDLAFFSDPGNRTALLLLSMGVRNLLMLATAGALLSRHRAAAYLVGLTALLGLIRRASFLAPLANSFAGRGWQDPTLMAFHSGADLFFRFILLGLVVDWLRRGEP